MIIQPPTQLIAEAWPSGHLIGKFELREAVSRSAFGIVYRAWDRDLGIAVAVKEHLPTSTARRLASGEVVPASPSAGTTYASSLQSFIQGTRALAHCDHPALVRVLHLQFAHGTAYRVMPWVDGDPLREVRRRMSRPPDERALRKLLDDLLGALEAVHRNGNTHGGVHPSQILLRPDDRVLLLGPCAIVTEGGVVPGPWTDLRGLADVARFWISGVLPTADRQPEPTAKIVERLFFQDHSVRYGHEFMHAIDTAASLDVAERPQSVAQFRERLRRAERVDAEASAGAQDRGNAAMDPAIASLIERAITTTSPTPAKLRPSRPEGKAATIKRPPRPASMQAIAARRRAGWVAGVFAALLAAAGFGVWHSLYRPAPTVIALAESVLPVPTSSAVPIPAPSSTVLPPEVLLPPIKTSAPSAANEAASPGAAGATPVEPNSAPTKRADVQLPPLHSPRQACGERTQFSLYLCMKQQCARTAWATHPQCVRFRATDEVE